MYQSALPKHKRCLIFTNLPYDLEEYILSLFWRHKHTLRRTLETMYSSDQLIRELYRRSKLLPSQTNSVPHSIPGGLVHSTAPEVPPLPLGYVREFHRIYRMSIEEINATGLTLQDLEIHPLVNLSYMLNNGIPDRLMSVDSIGYFETIIGLDRTLLVTRDSVLDTYDTLLADYWTKSRLGDKLRIVTRLFSRMKTDFFSEHGVLRVRDRDRKFRESAHRVLRFAFINDVSKVLFY